MGFRFRKSIKLFPGLRLNISKKGVGSVSVGVHGATLNVGKDGVHSTVGIPGTGISYREKISDSHEASKKILETASQPVEHTEDPSSIGIEHLKTWLIVGLVVVIAVILLNR